MAISKINPVAVSANANALTIPTAGTAYNATLALNSGIYTVTCASSTIATVIFLGPTEAQVAKVSTTSGTVTVNIATPVSKLVVFTNTGTDIVVTVTLTASALSGTTLSGTLDTITTTSTSYKYQTYNT